MVVLLLKVIDLEMFLKYKVLSLFMKKIVMFLILGLFVVSFASALKANVTLVDDIGSFSGAILKFKAPNSSSFSDKIYASEYHTEVGIVRFEVETSLSEIDVSIMTTMNGDFADEILAGPFVLNGSEIFIDKREVVENNNSVIAGNDSAGNLSVVGDEESVRESVNFTGNVVLNEDEGGSINWLYSLQFIIYGGF